MMMSCDQSLLVASRLVRELLEVIDNRLPGTSKQTPGEQQRVDLLPKHYAAVQRARAWLTEHA
jgi:hypothetical protein